ncbi:MAG TPA: molybdenum cofactor biosynthesis protein MoaE [Sphingomicrobium sp.]|nr:molybdenum cofactor biosynthesis protein MoaE [Sphingomicrobium sp.]
MIRVQRQPFDAAEELRAFMARAGEGAVATFIGTVRAEDGVEALTLDHYPGFTEKQITALVSAMIDQHRLAAAAVVHRFGRMQPGDPILFAATAAPHRRAALDALAELVERLKTEAPFWKKEQRGGIEHWLDVPRASDEASPERTLP